MFLRIENGALSLGTPGEAPWADIERILGGMISTPVSYGGEQDGRPVVLCHHLRAGRAANIWVPQLLQVLTGPVVLAGLEPDGRYRALTSTEQSWFGLLRLTTTPVPRLTYRGR